MLCKADIIHFFLHLDWDKPFAFHYCLLECSSTVTQDPSLPATSHHGLNLWTVKISWCHWRQEIWRLNPCCIILYGAQSPLKRIPLSLAENLTSLRVDDERRQRHTQQHLLQASPWRTGRSTSPSGLSHILWGLNSIKTFAKTFTMCPGDSMGITMT